MVITPRLLQEAAVAGQKWARPGHDAEDIQQDILLWILEHPEEVENSSLYQVFDSGRKQSMRKRWGGGGRHKVIQTPTPRDILEEVFASTDPWSDPATFAEYRELVDLYAGLVSNPKSSTAGSLKKMAARRAVVLEAIQGGVTGWDRVIAYVRERGMKCCHRTLMRDLKHLGYRSDGKRWVAT